MPRLNRKDSPRLSNSFTPAELAAVLELHACVLRGGDARQIAKSLPVCTVMRKFRGMQRDAAGAGTAGEAAS